MRKKTQQPKSPAPRWWSGLSWEAWDHDALFPHVAESPGVWVLVGGKGVRRPLYLRLAHRDDGQLTCTGLYLGLSYWDGDPAKERLPLPPAPEETSWVCDGDLALTGTELRNIKLGDLLNRLARSLDHQRSRSPAVQALMSKAPRIRKPKLKRPGRLGHPDEHYLGVVEAYEAKRSSRFPRTRIVAELAEAYGVDGSAIYRWLKQARKLGFLSP